MSVEVDDFVPDPRRFGIPPREALVIGIAVLRGMTSLGGAYALAAAAINHAHSRGARALEAYPMRTDAGHIAWDEIHVGSESIFAAAGMTEISRPGTRRIVMRLDFGHQGDRGSVASNSSTRSLPSSGRPGDLPARE